MEIDKITKMYFEGEVVGYDITYVNSNFKKSVPINEATQITKLFRNGLKRVVLL
jgi:hypothetical protein